jgi:arginine/lysine/ornithine decarboxylase
MAEKEPTSPNAPIKTSLEVLTERYSQLSDRDLILMLLDRVIEMEKNIDQIIDEMPTAEILQNTVDKVEEVVEVVNYEEIERKLDNLDFYLRSKE